MNYRLGILKLCAIVTNCSLKIILHFTVMPFLHNYWTSVNVVNELIQDSSVSHAVDAAYTFQQGLAENVDGTREVCLLYNFRIGDFVLSGEVKKVLETFKMDEFVFFLCLW